MSRKHWEGQERLQETIDKTEKFVRRWADHDPAGIFVWPSYVESNLVSKAKMTNKQSVSIVFVPSRCAYKVDYSSD